MGELNLDKLNAQLSRVSIREKKGNLYLRGRFPSGDALVRKEIALKLKANKDCLKIALAKAKEIDAQLMLGKWEEQEKKVLTVLKAITEFEKDYWTRYEPTPNRLYSWRKNQYSFFKELPQDEIFDSRFLKKAVTSFPPASYSQKRFCQLIRPVAKFHNINFDFTPFMQYQQSELNIRLLPTNEQILTAYNNEKYFPHKWALSVLALFGLRPHEFFKCEFNFENEPPVIYVGADTKKKKPRTVYPVPLDGLDLFEVPNQWSVFEDTCDLSRPNVLLGQNITEWFKKYPFTPYQLRHYYAVRGAMLGISPTFLSKWMGHSLQVHYKHYGSLLGDFESEQLWRDKFMK